MRSIACAWLHRRNAFPPSGQRGGPIAIGSRYLHCWHWPLWPSWFLTPSARLRDLEESKDQVCWPDLDGTRPGSAGRPALYTPPPRSNRNRCQSPTPSDVGELTSQTCSQCPGAGVEQADRRLVEDRTDSWGGEGRAVAEEGSRAPPAGRPGRTEEVVLDRPLEGALGDPGAHGASRGASLSQVVSQVCRKIT